MITDPTYLSDEELLQLLRQQLHIGFGVDAARRARVAEEASRLMLVLAERVYKAPEEWGLAPIPPGLRDDVAHDVLLALLERAPGWGEADNVAEWFGKQAERRFEELWPKAGGLDTAPHEPTVLGATILQVAGTEEELDTAASTMLDAPDGPWQRFEQEFPRDAFVLRLRYVLDRAPDEMMVMLDAPNTRAIHSRLSRARGRLRMFFEQSGYDRSLVAPLLRQFGANQGEVAVEEDA